MFSISCIRQLFVLEFPAMLGRVDGSIVLFYGNCQNVTKCPSNQIGAGVDDARSK